MADVSMEGLRTRVRVAMDENGTTTALLAAKDAETLALDELIDEKLLTAVRDVELRAPWTLLDGENVEENTEDTEGEMVLMGRDLAEDKFMWRMKLPERMLRLLRVKLTRWKTAARIISAEDAEYRWQQSRWTGVGGTAEKPVAAVVPGEDGSLWLELYSLPKDEGRLQYCTMVMEPTVEKGTIVGVSARLEDAIVHLAAAMTCATLGETQTAEKLESVAWRLAGVNG